MTDQSFRAENILYMLSDHLKKDHENILPGTVLWLRNEIAEEIRRAIIMALEEDAVERNSLTTEPVKPSVRT